MHTFVMIDGYPADRKNWLRYYDNICYTIPNPQQPSENMRYTCCVREPKLYHIVHPKQVKTELHYDLKNNTFSNHVKILACKKDDETVASFGMGAL